MSSIPILEVVSFSTEHSTHRITNLIKGTGKWTIPIKNISASRGQEITDLEAEFRLPPCQIEALDIGNFWTAICDTHSLFYKKRSKNMFSLDFDFLCTCFLFLRTHFG